MNQVTLSSFRQRMFSGGKILLRRFFSALFLLVFSPLFLVIDIFAPNRPEEACTAQGRTRLKLLCAYLLFMAVITAVVVFLYFGSTREARRLETVLGSFLHSAEVRSGYSQEVVAIVHKYAVRFDLNPHLVLAMIQVESGFNPLARSPKGACGLMQVTPLVWRHYNPKSVCKGRHAPGMVHGEDCIFAVEANIRTGMRLLRDLIDYFQGETGAAIEAYNAGLTNVDLAKGRPKYRETRDYLQRIGSALAPAARAQAEESFRSAARARRVFHNLALVAFGLWFLFIIWVIRHFPKRHLS
ncbi:MAG: transglycosylase SLT domain-containing protein [Clostridia bacterium]|nr:transglycosylase SLT domain-containing protein [Clostridia bacterium]